MALCLQGSLLVRHGPGGSGRRLLRLAPGRRRRPRVRHAAGRQRLRGDHRARPPRRRSLSASARRSPSDGGPPDRSRRARREAPRRAGRRPGGGPAIGPRQPAVPAPSPPTIVGVRPRTNFQLARIFGIRVGVGCSWFVVLFVFIILASRRYFHRKLDGSRTTAYLVAVASVCRYFASLVLHELGHALTARRLGMRVAGIDLWSSAGISRCAASPRRPARSSRSPPPARRHARRARRSASGAGVVDPPADPFIELAVGEGRLHDDTGARAARLAGVDQRARCSCSTSCPPSRSTAGASRARRSGGGPGTATARPTGPDAPARRFALALGRRWVCGGWLNGAGSVLGMLTHRARVLPLPGSRRGGRAGRARAAHPEHHGRRHHGSRAGDDPGRA